MQIYRLTHLIYELQKTGILQRALDYELEPDWTSLSVGYLNFLKEPARIFIHRSSRLCYYVFYEGKKLTFRKGYDIVNFVTDFIIESLNHREFMESMPGSDLTLYYLASPIEQKRRYNEWKVKRGLN